MVWTGLLAGFIAGILTLAIPSLIDRLGIPIGALTGIFIGDIFGAVNSLYLCVVLRKRSVWGSLGLILGSTVAYIVAMFTTFFAAGSVGFSQADQEGSTLGSAPILAFAIGGAVGAFLVLFAALTFFSDHRKLSRIFISSLKWSALGGVLGALGWAAGPLLGELILDVVGRKILSPSVKDDSGYYYSIYLVWQAGMGLALGLVFSGEHADVPIPNEASLQTKVRVNETVRIARMSFLVLATLVVGFFAFRSFPDQYKNARWKRAYNKHVADTPAIDNLAEVQPVPPDQVLILSRFGDYVPGRTGSGKTHPPMDAKTLTPRAPSAQAYSVRYALPGAPTSGPNVGPHADVQVLEYPNALWASHEVVDQGFGIDLGDPARPVKFGYRLYGQARSATSGQNGFYIWASNNRIVSLQFFSAEPDEVLKAYLEKFPPAPTDHI
jgi:MFS family permease